MVKVRAIAAYCSGLRDAEVVFPHIVEHPFKLEPHDEEDGAFENELDHAPVLTVGQAKRWRQEARTQKPGDQSGHDSGDQSRCLQHLSRDGGNKRNGERRVRC